MTVMESGVDVSRSRTGAPIPSTAPVLGLLRRLVPHDPVDAGDAGHAVLVADPLRQQPVPDLPGEHGGVLLLVFTDGINYGRSRHLGLAAAYDSGFVISRLIITAKKIENFNSNKFKSLAGS